MHPVARTLLNVVHASIPGAITYMECEEIGAQSKTAQRKKKKLIVNKYYTLYSKHTKKKKIYTTLLSF